MARLYLFAEGQTEQTFADLVLKPHLANLGVYLQGPVLIAHAKKKRIVHRGGGRNYLPMKNDIRRLLAQEKSKKVFFTTMIDLYAIHAEFPGLAEAEFPDYAGAKSVVGPRVAEVIGLEVIRSKCPHFASWLSRLEQLGAGEQLKRQ